MNVRGREKNVNSRKRRAFQSFPRACDIGFQSSAQAGDFRIPTFFRDGLNSGEIAFRSNCKPRLDYVNSKFFKLFSETNFFLQRH
jgi:hypothetical protein